MSCTLSPWFSQRFSLEHRTKLQSCLQFADFAEKLDGSELWQHYDQITRQFISQTGDVFLGPLTGYANSFISVMFSLMETLLFQTHMRHLVLGPLVGHMY